MRLFVVHASEQHTVERLKESTAKITRSFGANGPVSHAAFFSSSQTVSRHGDPRDPTDFGVQQVSWHSRQHRNPAALDLWWRRL